MLVGIDPHANISLTFVIRVCVLISLVFMASCNRQPSPVVFVDPALATLVPADTIGLAGIRMEQLAKTRFWTDYVQKGRVPMVDEFRRRTGLDPGKNLWEILVASNGKEGVVLVRGKFSDMGMEPKLNREGVERFSYKGLTMIGDEKNAVLFLNPSTAAAGASATLRRLVDNRNNVSGLPPLLADRIQKIPSTNQAWFAATVTGLIPSLGERNAGLAGNLARLAQSIDFTSGGLDLRQDFRSTIDFETKDAQQADRLSGAIRALLGLGRLNTTDKQREMLSIYDGMHVIKENSVVHFSTDIPYSVLEKAAAQIPMLGLK
ncbi:MAG: hypothetical protein H7Y20_17725 [Bryobacteraceae bacterium]|nr:hypothetical protein [Bryobacteraceae bacterium]